MGADQQFCLRWNNFHTNITSAFESLRDDEDFVDITLACEGRQIKAHKMVLSACSPYFRSLLRGNPCQHPIVFLKDVSFANLTSILDFMYHGEVNVSHNELATFLKTAEALRVRGLAEDEKKRDGDTCTESSSPPPPRDPPEPCSPGRPDDPSGEGGGGVRVSSAGDSGGGTTDTSSLPLSISEGPPTKRQRRRSGTNITTTITPSLDHDTTNADTDPLQQQQPQQQPQQQSETVGRESVKNEPEDYVNEDDDMLGQQQQQHQSQQHQQIANEDIKLDGFAGSNAADDQSEYLSGEGSISSRNQAAMQQLQDTFSTFIPGMTGQSPGSGFLQPPGSADHGRPHPPFSLEGVQGLPPGISALPGPSMSQAGGASQDASGQGGSGGGGVGGGSLYGTNHPSRRGHPSPFKRGGSGGNKSVLYRRTNCPLCARSFFNKYSLKRHMIQSHHENHVHTRPYSSFARSQTQFVKRILTEQWATREGGGSVSPRLGMAGVPPPPPPLTPSSVYGIDRGTNPPRDFINTNRGDALVVGSSVLDDGERGFMDRFNSSLARDWADVESGEDSNTIGGSLEREDDSSNIGDESSVIEEGTETDALCQSELLLQREVGGGGSSTVRRNSLDGTAFTQNFDFRDLT